MSKITTVSGKRIDVLDPDPIQFDIHDIGWALAKQNRYNGHTPEPYSVAQHSVLVSRLLEARGESPVVVLCGLLHDVAEYGLGDVISPVKEFLPRYQKIEATWEGRLAAVFEIPFPFPIEVRIADQLVGRLEQQRLRGLWLEEYTPPEITLDRCWDWREAAVEFFTRFSELTGVTLIPTLAHLMKQRDDLQASNNSYMEEVRSLRRENEVLKERLCRL